MATTVAAITNRIHGINGVKRYTFFDYTHDTSADNLLETGLARVEKLRLQHTNGQTITATATFNSKTAGTANLDPGWVTITAATLTNSGTYTVYAEGT